MGTFSRNSRNLWHKLFEKLTRSHGCVVVLSTTTRSRLHQVSLPTQRTPTIRVRCGKFCWVFGWGGTHAATSPLTVGRDFRQRHRVRKRLRARLQSHGSFGSFGFISHHLTIFRTFAPTPPTTNTLTHRTVFLWCWKDAVTGSNNRQIHRPRRQNIGRYYYIYRDN